MNKIVCFDVNGTLVDNNSWDIFTKGDEKLDKEIEELFACFYRKEITIEEAWSKMVACLKTTGRANKDFICNCWEKEGHLKEGAEEIISYLKEKGYKIYLVSCSIDTYLNCIVDKFGLDGVYAGSRLVFDATGELLSIESDCMEGRGYKARSLEDLAKKEGVDVKDIVFIGDSDNDVEVFKMTEHGIAIGNKNEELIKNSWKQVCDLSEIREIL